MSRILVILFLLLSVALVGDASAPYRNAHIEIGVLDKLDRFALVSPSNAAPIIVGDNSHLKLRVRTATQNLSLGGYVQVDAKGGHLFAAIAGHESAIALGPGYDRCTDTDAMGVWHCRIPFRFQGSGQIDITAISEVATIVGTETVVVKGAVVAGLGIQSLLVFLGVLSVVGLVFLVISIDVTKKVTTLAALGSFWLLISSGVSGAILLVAVIGIYGLLRWQLAVPSSSRRYIASVGITVTAFVLVKYCSVTWAGSFANPGAIQLAVPLGFAFFIIRVLDLSFRIGIREIRAVTLREYLSYMLFPATLAAGPIYTWNQFSAAAITRVSIVDWSAGLARIAVGIFKKVIGDILLARLVGPKLVVLYANPLGMQARDLWLLLLANSLYVYLDFSGYSDIAIGIGRQLGWRVPENFDFPFLQSSMRAFWQRWHVTLSAWVSRWVHFFTAFSLRRSNVVAKATLPVVTCLCVIGLWHEMQLSWFGWGLHHSIGILLGDAVIAGAAALTITRSRWRIVSWTRYVAGVAFVWAWVALSHCFTLISDPLIAIHAYGSALGFGLF